MLRWTGQRMSIIPALLGHESRRQVDESSSLAYSEVNGNQSQLQHVGRWPTYTLSCTCFLHVCQRVYTCSQIHEHAHTYAHNRKENGMMDGREKSGTGSIILNEVTKARKDKCHVFCLVCRFQHLILPLCVCTGMEIRRWHEVRQRSMMGKTMS